MSDMMEIPLSRITPLNSARVMHENGGLVLLTAPAQWNYSAEGIFEVPGIEAEPRVLHLRLSVESGVLGLGWLTADGTGWVARATQGRTGTGPAEIKLEIPQGCVGGKLVFDNATEGGQPSVAIIEKIAIGDLDREALKLRVKEILHRREGVDLNPPLPPLETAAKRLSKEEFVACAPAMPIMQNFATSVWEYVHGVTELTAYPWNITIPVADLCNARCTFCTSWLDGRKVLDLDQLERFEAVLRHALAIGLVGHGEPLAHPRFDELCDRLAQLRDPMSKVYTITNGFFLEKWRDHLERINLYSYSVSLNAATPETHDIVMGLGKDAFPRIVNSIAELLELGKRSANAKNVFITMVVTQQNIAEIPAFIELGNRLGVSGIWFRSLLPQANLLPGLNYHLIPPYLHPDFERLRRSAVAAIQASQVPVQADPGLWGQKIFSEAFEQQILLKPPPTISREQALRDRELRHRNEFLYHQEEGIFRGRPLEHGVNSLVRWTGGRLTVVTPRAHGAYAAAVPVNYPADGEQRLRVEIDADCAAGVLGLGLLDVAKNEWLDRAAVEPGPASTVVLTAVATGQRLQLVVYNAGDGAEPAQGSLGAVRLRVEGIGQSLPVEWELLTVHNAADPLDDGTNPLGREPRFACKAVYYNCYINEFFYRMNPCCYLQQVPGFEEVRLDGDMTFMDAWNSPGMVELRRRLAEGPLYGACMRCPEKW